MGFFNRFTITAIIAPALFITGCSVDMFSKTERDPLASGRGHYRKIRAECSGLQIQSTELTVSSFRSLIQCFNANGSLPEIAILVSESTEKGLAQSVELLNDAFLRNPKVLRESREIMQRLQQEGSWESGIQGFRSLLESPESLRALVRLTSMERTSPSILVQSLDALEPRETIAAFELIGRLASSPAYRSLTEKIQKSPLNDSEKSRLIKILEQFLKKETPHRSAFQLVQDLAAGKSGSLWSYVLGEKSDDLLDATSRFYTLLKDFGFENGKPLRQLSRFHQSFHRPISCWGGGKTFVEPWKNLASELKSHSSPGQFLPFIFRFASTTTLTVDGFCAIPKSFLGYYPTLTGLALGRSGGEYVEVVRQVFASDLGVSAGYFVGEWGESLSEILSILEKKEWFGDIILLIAELDSSDRDQIAIWTAGLLRNHAEWTELSARWSTEQIHGFFSDLGSVLSLGPGAITEMMHSFHLFYEVSDNHPWFDAWKRVALKSADNGLEALTKSDPFPAASIALAKMAEDGSLADLLSAVVELVSGNTLPVDSSAFPRREVSVRRPLRHTFSVSDLMLVDSTLDLDSSLRACARLDLNKTATQQWSTYEKCMSGGGVSKQSLKAFSVAKSWKMPSVSVSNGSLLSDSFFESIIQLPLSTQEKGALLKVISSHDPADSFFSVDSFLAILKKTKIYVSVEIFRILHELEIRGGMNERGWNIFFQKFQAALEDPALPSLYDSLSKLNTPAQNDPHALERLKPPRMPQMESLADSVEKIECEKDGGKNALQRAADISSEYRDAVLGWERLEGKLPTAWNATELKVRMRAFSKSIGSPVLRQHLYEWISGNASKDIATWFWKRSGDAVAVTVMDSDGKLHVRWMSTLDRLESILVNSNFSYGRPFFVKNHGIRFIEKFSEAWGDEPREAWPKEIQARYRGRKQPPTLREVQAEVRQFLHTFQLYGGLPPIPNCAKAALGGQWSSNPLVSREIQAKVYNLRQTLSVIDENLPGSEHPNREGMRFLRGLFWTVRSSEGNQNEEPLRFFQKLGDLGALRSVSRGLQTLQTREDLFVLEDVFASLSTWAADPSFDDLVARVLTAPHGFDPWIEAAFLPSSANGVPNFEWNHFISRVFSIVAMDRETGLIPIALKAVSESLEGRSFPEFLVAETVRFLGEPRSPDGSLQWMTLRSSPESKVKMRKEVTLFGLRRILPLLRAFPIGETLDLLNRDPMLRKDFWTEARKWTAARQAAVDREEGKMASSPTGHRFLKGFFAKENPELRRAVGLWCGTSAGTYVSALSARPDEAALMIDGLLQSLSSPMTKDLIEAMLRQLPD